DLLVAGPPVTEATGLFAGAFAQQQKVVAGAKARVFQQQVGAFAAAPRQALLHVPDFLDRQGETLGNGDPSALFGDQFVGGFLHRRDRRQTAVLLCQYACRQGRPEQRGEQKSGGDRLALGDAFVGIGQCQADQLVAVVGVVLECLGRGREQRGEQVVVKQQLEGAFGLT